MVHILPITPFTMMVHILPKTPFTLMVHILPITPFTMMVHIPFTLMVHILPITPLTMMVHILPITPFTLMAPHPTHNTLHPDGPHPTNNTLHHDGPHPTHNILHPDGPHPTHNTLHPDGLLREAVKKQRHRKEMFRQGRLSKKLKCERLNRQCTTLTISIDFDIWMKARRARHHLEQQLSQVTVVQTLLPPGWSKVGDLEFAKVVKDSDAILKLSRCVVIDDTMQWHVQVDGKKLMSSVLTFSQVPQHLTSLADVKTLLDLVHSCHVCCGNGDERFMDYILSKDGKIMNRQGTECVAYLDIVHSTIRHAECDLLMMSDENSGQRCNLCRSTLRALLSRHEKLDADTSRTDPSSHASFSRLSSPDKCIRYHREHQLRVAYQRQVTNLQMKLQAATEERGISLDSSLHDDLLQIMQDNAEAVCEAHPPGSFGRVFWETQMKAASLDDAQHMCGTLSWCGGASTFVIRLSSSAYEMIRETCTIKLPSQRTLRDYTYHTKAVVGFSSQVDQYLSTVAKLSSCMERDKCVIIIFDEMHIRQDLKFDKHSGGLTGFVDIGNINNHLSQYESQVCNDDIRDSLASSMLVLMISGLFTNLKFPYAQFPCTELSGDQLFPMIWNAVSRLENLGFIVLALCCDGLSSNRKFFRLHDADSKTPVNKVINPYAHDGDRRYIFFLSDPPHLMKTTRNCWANPKRKLWCNGMDISWDHLKELYMKNRSQGDDAGLSLVPKLKYEHLLLTSYSKMRVDLAAQVK
ncbi:hypothetical protein EMCRGX_G006110 [Ephydatia muelleri]